MWGWLLTVRLMADWVSEWVSEQLKQMQGASRQTNVGLNREMLRLQLGTAGCITDGESIGVRARGCSGGLGWDGLGWGLSRAEGRPQPQGTLLQRAIDMEALCGINCGLLAAGDQSTSYKKKKKIRGREREKRERKRGIHPSVHASTSHSVFSRSANQLHSAALVSWPDHCYTP